MNIEGGGGGQDPYLTAVTSPARRGGGGTNGPRFRLRVDRPDKINAQIHLHDSQTLFIKLFLTAY